MEVTKEIYKFLNDLKLVTPSQKPTKSGVYKIDQKTIQKLENGYAFPAIIKRLNKIKLNLDKPTTPLPDLNELKQVTTPSTKLYNWNIISRAMDSIGITLDQDQKSLIVAGETSVIENILQQLVQAEQDFQKQEPQDDYKLGRHTSLPNLTPQDEKKRSRPNIDTINPEKPLFEADSILEFIILSFCHGFSIQPSQAKSLLKNKNKLLITVAKKGSKGRYEQVIFWYQDIYSNTERISDLLVEELDSKSLFFVLDILKVGFFSENIEVMQWAWRVFSKLGLEFYDQDNLEEVFQWFSQESGALETSLSAVQRLQGDTFPIYVEMVMQISTLNLLELFTDKLKEQFEDNGTYLKFMHDFLIELVSSQTFVEDVIHSGVVRYWMELATQEIDGQFCVTAISFLADIWTLLHDKLEDTENLAATVLSSINRSWKHTTSTIQQISLFAILFNLLYTLSEMKDSYAPIVYKTLAFHLVENHDNMLIREFMLSNFKEVVIWSKSIPVQILLDPLIKRIQTSKSKYQYDTYEIDFLITVCDHPRMTITNAIQLIDLLAKIYLNDPIYARAASVGFTTIAAKFLETEAMQEYLYVFWKIGCGMVIKQSQNGFNRNKKVKTFEQKIENQKKVFFLDMIYWIVTLENYQINDRIKELVILANQEYRKINKGQDFKGFLAILQLFGDPLLLTGMPNALDIDKVQKFNSKHDSGQIAGSEDFPRGSMFPVHNYQGDLIHKGTFPWKLAAKDIRDAKRKRKMLDERRIQEEEKARKRLAFKKKNLQKQLEVRKVQQNIERRETINMILEDGAVPKEAPKIDIKEWELPAEQREIDDIAILTGSYCRVFKQLFTSFTNTGHTVKFKNVPDFDWLAERKRMLVSSEIIRIFVSHTVVPKLLKKSELITLLKIFWIKVCKNQEGATYCNYEQFIQFFVQLAMYVYNKPEKSLERYPPVVSVKALLDYMRDALQKQGKSTEVYDEPDRGTGDLAVCKLLNEQLAEDPEVALPNGYERYVDYQLMVGYPAPETLSPWAQDVYSILDDIILNKFGFHIMPSEVNFAQLYRARGAPKKKKLPTISAPPTERFATKPKFAVAEKRSIESELVKRSSNVHLSPTLKLELAKAPSDDREIYLQCAAVLEDLAHAVSLRANHIIRRTDADKRVIVNKALLKRQEQMTNEIEFQKERNRKRLQRRQFLEEHNARARVVREERMQQLRNLDNQHIAKLQSKKKANIAQRKLASTTSRAQIQEWRAEKIAMYDKELETTMPKINPRIQQQHEKQRLKNIKQHRNAIKDRRIKLKEAQSERLLAAEWQKSQDLKNAQISAKLLNSAKEAKERSQKKKVDIENMEIESKPILKKYEAILKAVFDFYRRQTLIVGDDDACRDILYNDLNKFNSFFNIYPGLITVKKAAILYRQIVNNKKETSLNYTEFCSYLIRVAANATKKLRAISGRSQIVSDAPQVDDLVALFTWLGFNTTEAKINNRLNEQLKFKAVPNKAKLNVMKKAIEHGQSLQEQRSEIGDDYDLKTKTFDTLEQNDFMPKKISALDKRLDWNNLAALKLPKANKF